MIPGGMSDLTVTDSPDHLPECPAAFTVADFAGNQHPSGPCLCYVLQACERRVRAEEQDCDNHGDTIRYRCKHYRVGWADGNNTGLDAAIDAVISLGTGWTAAGDDREPYWLITKADASEAIEQKRVRHA